MKIVLIHNAYQQAGGEDAVLQAEAALLSEKGHEVTTFRRRNDEIQVNGFLSQARLGWETVWARSSYRQLQAILQSEKPDLAHVHNTLPLISPAAYYACQDAGVPVVQTLHNYRLFCPAATFYRDGHVCEECLEKSLTRSLRYACYRGSRSASAAVAAMLAIHRQLGTWQDKVDVYIALSEFARGKFIAAGLSAEKIVVKPNFVCPDPGPRAGAGEYALFVGRLSPEKGVQAMLSAWKRLGQNVPLEIVGGGPEREKMEAQAPGIAGIRFRGRLPRAETLAAIKGARFLVFPSQWYECFPLTLVEAFACGTPVIASRLGAMAEVVKDGRTGLHFTPGDPTDLAAKVMWAWEHPEELAAMGREARAEYESKYTADTNYEQLLAIYEKAMKQGAGRPPVRGWRT